MSLGELFLTFCRNTVAAPSRVIQSKKNNQSGESVIIHRYGGTDLWMADEVS
jgi:hypothetical protein